MSARLRRTMLLLGTIILVIQTAFMPIGILSAETTIETDEHESVELPSTQNSLEELINNPSFYFQQSDMQGIVNSPIHVTISSDQEVSKVKVRLPEEATVLKDQLPEGTSVVQGDQPNEWIVQSESVQTTFVLPLVFESEGNYELLLEDTTAKIEIINEDDIVEEGLLEEDSSNDSTSKKDRDSQMGEDLTSEEIRFSIDVGEYLEVQKDETFGIEVTTNQMINSLRIIIPKGTEFEFSDEKKRTHIQTYDDESSLWLITFNHESDRFPATVSVSDSGQISVEDSNGEINSAFLYVNTGVSTRNTKILSESAARTTVTVSTWATFRTAWNNNSRTVIDATTNIPGGTTALNTRTSNVIIRSSTATVGQIAISPTNLSWSGATVTLESTIILSAVVISGTNLEIRDRSTVSILGGSSLQNLNIDTSGSAGWPQLSISGSLSINQNLSVSNAWIRTVNTINVGGIVTLNNSFLIQSDDLRLPIQTSNMVKNLGNTGFAVWENVVFRFTTPATRFWSNLTFTLSGNSITHSSQPTFNDSTFKLTNGVTAISSRNFSGGEGSVVMPPVPEEEKEPVTYTLSLEATPIEGGIPAADLDKIEEEESTKITANPNEGYDFIQWEIVSGSGSTLEDETSPETTFTMGSEDTVVRAVFEKENKDLEPVNPVDPLDPEVEVNPENKPELPDEQGQLSLDFISSFNFGSQKISVSDQTYYAQPQRLLNENGTVDETAERPNYVQISDRRPTNERNGWQLSVTQNGQFRNENEHELMGSEIQLFNQELVTVQGGTSPKLQEEPVQRILPNTRKILLQAEGESGTGTWIYRFGDAETAEESVTLNVPKGANPEATTYSTKLTWELSSVPDN